MNRVLKQQPINFHSCLAEPTAIGLCWQGKLRLIMVPCHRFRRTHSAHCRTKQVMEGTRTLGSYGYKEGQFLVMVVKQAQTATSNPAKRALRPQAAAECPQEQSDDDEYTVRLTVAGKALAAALKDKDKRTSPETQQLRKDYHALKASF